MPTYDYRCDGCGHEFEEFQSMTAKPLKKCPSCGTLQLRRLIGTGAGIIFKGSGFYETDYRSKDYQQKAKAEQQSASGGDQSGGSDQSSGGASAGSGGGGEGTPSSAGENKTSGGEGKSGGGSDSGGGESKKQTSGDG